MKEKLPAPSVPSRPGCPDGPSGPRGPTSPLGPRGPGGPRSGSSTLQVVNYKIRFKELIDIHISLTIFQCRKKFSAQLVKENTVL